MWSVIKCTAGAERPLVAQVKHGMFKDPTLYLFSGLYVFFIPYSEAVLHKLVSSRKLHI